MFANVNIKEIKIKKRFDSQPFVSSNAFLVRISDKIPSLNISDLCKIHKVRNRDSRIYVNDKTKGIRYLSNSDIQSIDESRFQYMSRKFLSNIEEQKIKNQDLLVSAVGTIGIVAFVNELIADSVISGNILRITPYKFNGYIYSYFVSKYGQANLKQIASGSVQDFITPPKLSEFKIPILPEATQQKIHNLITEASQLRVEANKLLKEATIFFDDRYTTSKKTKYKLESIKLIGNSKRLNSHYFVSPGRYIEDDIRQSPHILLKDLVIKIFTSGRDKRTYVKKILGIPFLSNSEMTTRNPFANCNYLSKKKVDPTSPIKKNYLMTGRVGLIGQIYFPFDYLIGSIASDNIIRIEFKSIDEMHLVYAFFASKIGNNLLTRRKTGVTQPFITEEMLYDIPIPILNKGEINTVQNNIAIFSFKIQSAFTLENQAIDLIEKEIDQWQQL